MPRWVAAYLTAVVVVLVVVLMIADTAESSTSTFEVVVTGDSILRLSEGGILGPGRFVDAEDGRQVNVRGTSGRMTSTEAVRWLTPMVQPGGWFVFQDNGAQATQAEWRTLLKEVVQRLPDDRCLLGVLPVFTAPPAAQATFLDTAAKANIMVEEFAAQPCHDYVRWNQKVLYSPEGSSTWVYDGQHPTAAGALWLAGDITRRTGHDLEAQSCPV